jgi:hypothetical protein
MAMVDVDDEEKAQDRATRATPQFKEALRIISPARQHQADCESDVVGALMSIDFSRGIHSRRSPAEKRKLLQRLAKTLHRAVDLADRLEIRDWWWDFPMDLIPERIGDVKTCRRRCPAGSVLGNLWAANQCFGACAEG